MMQIDAFEDPAFARDEALQQVADNSGGWFTEALDALEDLEPGARMTGEDIRHALIRRVGIPHHHNAWGALIRAAITRNLIRPTGHWKPMQARRSHARRTPVYAVNG